jgi:drug/metabolite transporter (DMT)-like permease
MSGPQIDNRAQAALLALFAVAVASIQDAIVKHVSGSYPVTETIIVRCLVSSPLLAIMLLRNFNLAALRTPHLPLILLRSIILCSAYFAFVLSLAAMPMANAVAIYFTMPFFVAGLSAPVLHERVPIYRWIAIVIGFSGVLMTVRPGAATFEPAALLSLYSALGYAIGQMIGRKLSRNVDPLVISNWQNAVYLAVAVLVAIIVHALGLHGETHRSLAFLTRPFAWPTARDGIALCLLGALAAFAMVSFVRAYQAAPANFVAPFEYSAMIWAVGFGYFLFGDIPDGWTRLGICIVVLAGLFMLYMDARRLRLGTRSTP